MPVPAGGEEEEDRPVKAGKMSDGDDDAGGGDERKPTKKGGSNKKLIIIIGGSVLAFCCVCTGLVGGVGYYLYGVGQDVAAKVQKELDNMPKEKFVFQKDVFQKDKGVVAGGPTIFEKKETLTDKDPKIANGKAAKAYKVKLEAGKKYVIDLKANNKVGGGDPYLFLLDPQGKQVAFDDDGGGFPNAQIRYTPAVTGEFTIQATSLGAPPPGGMGFTLTVKLE